MASDDETAPNHLSGEDDDIPTDEDSVGSLAEFIVNSDEESDESGSGSDSGAGESEEEEEGAEDIEVDGEKPEWINEANIIEGGRARRKRKAPERYQDENYAKLMISDSEASLSSSEPESGEESDDDDFRYESDDSGTGTNDSDSGGETKRSRVE